MKRNGSEAAFDREKIAAAVTKANLATDQPPELSGGQVAQLALSVEQAAARMGRTLSVEEIQELVETEIMRLGAFETAKRYIRYRYIRSLARAANTTDSQILTLIECNNEEAKQENANKNPVVNSVQRDYMAGEVSKDITQRLLLPPDIVEAHKAGIIHFHDMDYYAQHMHNCDLVNLEDMLQNGTVISGTLIEKPHSFSTACNIATQIIAQVASNQYGGQSISLAHLAPFVQVSREKIRGQVLAEIAAVGGTPSEEVLSGIVEKRLREEIRRGVQTIQYQVVTLMTTNGQAPFVTVFMYLGEVDDPQTKRDLALIIEETLVQRYEGVKNEEGVWITPAFPKLIYVLEEDNVRPGTPYYYLTRLAAKCTARRLVPDYISEKIMKQNKVDQNGEGQCYTCMGCRSFLTPYVDPETGKPKYYGRFNQGVVTINLVDVALSSGGDREKFWKVFDERLELCYRALMCRHERLKGTLSDAAPILWQYGALARLKKGEPIDRLLYNGYSTISLGYAGLYECVKYMTGRSHTDPEATPLRPGGHGAHEPGHRRLEGQGAHRLLPLRHAAGVHHLQVRQVSAKALRRHPRHHRQVLHHQQLPRPRHRGDRRLLQAVLRGPVPGPLPRRRHQLCGGARHAAEPGGRAPGHGLHLRPHHVRRAEHQERLLPGVRL